MRHKRHSSASEEENSIDLTPMLDVVFIMLIFFIVTTSFIKPAGITVNQPSASTSERKQGNNILVAISPQGDIWIDKQQIDLGAVRATVERLKAENPEGAVIIQADQDSKSGMLVKVMDQVRLAGVQDYAIAAQVE